MRVIGLMSGTSMDGIDGVVMETNGEENFDIQDFVSLTYDKTFGQLLKSQTYSGIDPSVVQVSTDLHGEVIQQLIDRNRLKKSEKIELIGYHGQTIYHCSQKKISLQVGNAQYLANKFRIPVVHDFRSNDLRHGGQGAPLAPLYHQALMRKINLKNLIMVNIGGIANVSVVLQDKILAGFDAGPGNCLLDKFVQQWTHYQCLMDKNGQFAQQGKIDDNFLDILAQKTIQHNYYLQSWPKSLDINDIVFVPEIMQRFPQGNQQNLYDGCATLAAFTANIIVNSLARLKGMSTEDFFTWSVAGGGAKNPAILSALQLFVPKNHLVKTADEIGFNTVSLEAELIGWLAVRSLKKLPLTVPETTGVIRSMTGGTCFWPTLEKNS